MRRLVRDVIGKVQLGSVLTGTVLLDAKAKTDTWELSREHVVGILDVVEQVLLAIELLCLEVGRNKNRDLVFDQIR